MTGMRSFVSILCVFLLLAPTAGFAADAYARLNGLGVACVTYGVGGLKVANTTAEAFAEMVPALVISGAPGLQERLKNPRRPGYLELPRGMVDGPFNDVLN